MKKRMLLKLIAITTMLMLQNSFTSCTVHTHRTVVKTKRLPPGQAKKIHGGKSAKRYAPGHR